MTREHAIQVAITALATWHDRDHGDRCHCIEGEQFGAQAAAVMNGLVAAGMAFDDWKGAPNRSVGPPLPGREESTGGGSG